jgi:hypothetical protein
MRPKLLGLALGSLMSLRPQPTGRELGCPKAFVHFARLVFEEWPGDDDRLLPAGKDFAAGQIKGGILLVAAGVAQEGGFRQREDNAAHADAIDGAGTHGAGFGAGVEGAAGEFGLAQQLGSLGAGHHFRVLRGVAGWAHCIVACGHDSLAALVYDERAKRVAAIVASLARQIDRLP